MADHKPTIVGDGPLYICKSCRYLIRVPVLDTKIEVDKWIQELEYARYNRDGYPYLHTKYDLFKCPHCEKENIVNSESVYGTTKQSESLCILT